MGKETEHAEEFARDLVDAYGDNLKSVVLYGSAARGQFQEGVSDLNILVLLDNADPAAIRRGSALAREWVGEGNPPPLLLSVDELRRSLDVFPIEYSDIREAHQVLHGADPFADLEIDLRDLRLQCEHELKGKQIQLRERYLLSADEPEELTELFRRSISTFVVLFRTVLRLAREPVPQSTEEVVRQSARLIGFEPDPLLQILRTRRDPSGLEPEMLDRVAIGYLDAVSQTVNYVDRLHDEQPA